MKKNCLFALLLFASISSFCQEEIWYMYGANSDNSILREVQVGEWLCFNVVPTFSVVNYINEASYSNVPYIYLWNVKVFDFEIKSGWVYFCGEYLGGENPCAVLGKFQLSSFPSTTVYIYKLPALRCLNKLEMYAISGHRYALMIGEAENGDDYFVSGFVYGGVGPCVFSYSLADDYSVDVLDDIAITDKYVVVSGRKTSENKGYLYYFYLPVYIGAMYATNTQYGYLNNNQYLNPIRILHCEQDWIVTASNDVDYYDVTAFDSTHFEYSVRVPRQYTTFIKDLAYNRTSKELELLASYPQNSQSGNCSSYIIHLDSSLIGWGTATCHFFSDNNIQSLYKRTPEIGHINEFCATGENCIYQFRWYKYNSHLWKRCSEKKTYDAEVHKILFEPEKHKYTYETFEAPANVLEKADGSGCLESICPEKQQNVQ
ncbi:MAG: hypothetical protein K6E96_04595 [Bacteroidales bacterium]|nr:hypothetical protein [Bacteroidales bacterium]